MNAQTTQTSHHLNKWKSLSAVQISEAFFFLKFMK